MKSVIIFIITIFILNSACFVQGEAVPESAVEIESAKSQEVLMEIPADAIVWIEDSLPEDATQTGKWQWIQDIKLSGESSHTDGVKEGLHFHSFKVPGAIKLKGDSAIEQFVYLDPGNPPRGIMLKFISLDGKETDLYWEAEEEVFGDTVEYMEAWYMGFLPEAGGWHRLVINMDELEITTLELIGISFITYDGRTYWDRTVIKND